MSVRVSASHILPDYLRPGLVVVFVGFNPSLRSAEIGHYYAGRGNQFWPFLYETGFTDVRLRPEEDSRVLDFGIGLTDIVKRLATRGIGGLGEKDYTAGFPILGEKVRRFKPKIVCLNGKSGYQRFLGHRCEYGLQPDPFEGSVLFLAPSTSGALPMARAEKLKCYTKLKEIADGMGRGATVEST